MDKDTDAFFGSLAGKAPSSEGSPALRRLGEAARSEVLAAEAWQAAFQSAPIDASRADEQLETDRLVERLRVLGHFKPAEAGVRAGGTARHGSPFEWLKRHLPGNVWAMPVALAASLVLAVVVVIPQIDEQDDRTRAGGTLVFVVDDAQQIQQHLVSDLEAAGVMAVSTRIRQSPMTWRVHVEVPPEVNPDSLRPLLNRVGIHLDPRPSFDFDLVSERWYERIVRMVR